MEDPNLETLKTALQKAGVQAEIMLRKYDQPGRTNEVCEQIAYEIQRGYTILDDEIRQLHKHGEKS